MFLNAFRFCSCVSCLHLSPHTGKSTLFKQMIQIYGKGYPESERKNFIPIIYNNIIMSMKVLCQQCDSFQPVNEENQQAKKLIEDLKGDEEIDDAIGNALQNLWADPGIQVTYDNRAAYQLTDSTKYFLDQLHLVCQPNYLPSEQDVLRSRVRTTGIVENDFEIENNQFKMSEYIHTHNAHRVYNGNRLIIILSPCSFFPSGTMSADSVTSVRSGFTASRM